MSGESLSGLVGVDEGIWRYAGGFFHPIVVPRPHQLVTIHGDKLANLQFQKVVRVALRYTDGPDFGGCPCINWIRQVIRPPPGPLETRHVPGLVQSYIGDFVAQAGKLAFLRNRDFCASEANAVWIIRVLIALESSQMGTISGSRKTQDGLTRILCILHRMQHPILLVCAVSWRRPGSLKGPRFPGRGALHCACAISG